MEEIKPKKERKFLKTMGEVALTLVRELLLNAGKKLINKSGNKRQGLVLALIILASTFAIAQYPTTGNKQRLGYQTTGDGLVFRGRASDTTVLKPSTINNAYHLFDTLNNVLFSYIKTKGGWKFNNSDTVIIQGVTMPFDSITFNTAKDGTVGVGEVEYNDTQGSLIQGLKGGLVTNVIGQQLHQRVNNRTGATLNKGDVVYLSGSQGNRITVAKALGVTDAFSANTFGIVAENIADNASGFIITEGLITGLNTSALTEDSAVYLSPTVAGALTSTKPQAPQHSVYIGVCVKSNAGSGELFVKIRNGQELDELHDVRITSPVDRASLYYKLNEKLWRDTTAALLVSDTASMLTNYLRSGIAASTYQPILVSGTNIKTVNSNSLLGSGNISVGNITGNGVSQYFAIFGSSTYISQSLLRWDGNTVPNSKLISDFNFNDFNGTLSVTGATTLSNLAGTGVRMVVASSTGLLSTQSIGTSVTSFSAGTTGLTPSTATTGAVTLAGTLAVANGGTGATNQSDARTNLGATVRGSGIFTLPDISQISFVRYNANNTISQRTAEGIRLDLGGTTIGQNMFMLTNPSAITFPRFNADNTASALSAADFRTAIGVSAGGVTSVTASLPLLSSGGATPNITITDAGTGASGVVNTTTQSFAGNKTFTGTLDVSSTGTFGGRVKTNWLERNYAYNTSSSFTVSVNTTWQDINTSVLTTLTLPNAATYPGKELHIRQSGTGQLQSASSNVIPFTSAPTAGAGTAILNPTNNRAVTLVSDGTNWIIMQRSGN